MSNASGDFHFVNYHSESAIDDDGDFKVTRKQKHDIPNIKKFKLDYPNRQSSTGVNEDLDLSQSTHTFSAATSNESSGSQRKTSYTISTLVQRITLVQLVKKLKVYKRKPQIDAWSTISRQYNSVCEIEESEGLTLDHARTKFRKILTSAERKNEKKLELDYAEELALEYKQEQDAHLKRKT